MTENVSVPAAKYSRRDLNDGTAVVAATVDLPKGWNRDRTTVEFVLPQAFPSAQPDCFFADFELRLADAALPANTGFQALDGQERLWFSWHLSTWNPAHDTVETYLRFIERRLNDPR